MKLILDESKIRKGKPVGLPYIGSKKKISKKIVEVIKQNFDTDKPIYDVFGGGGAITAECILNGLDVYYNDLDNTVTDVFQKVINSDREWIKTLIVSRDEFFSIRKKENKTVDDELKLLINSFGNNGKNYLYSKENSDLKYNLAVKILKNHDVFYGYKQTDTYIFFKEYVKNKQLDRLQQLQQLQQIERLQNIKRPKITNKTYHDFSELKETILYLDPPYENTTNSYKFEFNSNHFYDWAFEMSKNNIVLISSYEVNDDRFEEVFIFDKAISTFHGKIRNSKCEKLFMARWLLFFVGIIKNNQGGRYEMIDEQLTDKQQIFADEYLRDLNGTRAYKIAYHNIKKDSVSAAAAVRMLRNVKVRKYIDEHLEKMHNERTADNGGLLYVGWWLYSLGLNP